MLTPHIFKAPHRGAMSIWLMKTPAAPTPPKVEEIVRNKTASRPLQPENPTATRNAAGNSKPVGLG